MNDPIYEGWYNRDLTPITSDEQLIAAADIENRQVAHTRVGDLGWVSTIFLRLDHSFTEEGPPILFETLVFGGPLDGDMERYCTEEEALAGHCRMVERVRKTASLWDRFKAWLER